MLPLNFKMLTPWNLSPVHPVYLGEMHVNKRTLHSITFSEISSMHKSPTIGVSLNEIMDTSKKINKYLNVSSYATSQKELRPDLSDIEIALIHATWENIPVEHMATTLNITVTRLKQIRKATEHLYKQAGVRLPQLPLVTLTDTSRYWSEDEVINTYGDILTSKDLLRRASRQSQDLNFPINAQLYSSEDNKDTIPNRAGIPSEVPWQDEENYRELSDILWTYVSREDGVSNLLSFTDWDSYNSIIRVNIFYHSSLEVKGKVRVIDHDHMEGGYFPPLNLPKPIIQLAVDIINKFILSGVTPPAIENLTLQLLSAPEYILNQMNINFKPFSQRRGHCLPFKDGYHVNSTPLIYPKFHHNHYGYGVLCKKCSLFLSNHTVNECKHIKLQQFYHKIPLIYMYFTTNTPDVALYYYKLDTNQLIHSIFTLNLLEFYSNFSIPLHITPFEA